MKSLGSLRMGLISATLTVAAAALALPTGLGETCRLQDKTPHPHPDSTLNDEGEA